MAASVSNGGDSARIGVLQPLMLLADLTEGDPHPLAWRIPRNSTTARGRMYRDREREREGDGGRNKKGVFD